MAVTNLYQGQSANISCIIQDADGVPYAHSAILEVWAILTIITNSGNERVYLRWSKNAKDGYITAITSATVGKYEFLVERTKSKAFPSDGNVYIEITAKLDSAIFADEFVHIDKQLVYKMKPAQSKSI